MRAAFCVSEPRCVVLTGHVVTHTVTVASGCIGEVARCTQGNESVIAPNGHPHASECTKKGAHSGFRNKFRALRAPCALRFVVVSRPGNHTYMGDEGEDDFGGEGGEEEFEEVPEVC